jgi:hypothetical protein
MAKWPHQETPLSEQEKAAYLHLMYQAMLDIRNLCQPRLAESLNPLAWRQYYRNARVAGALADWLHNLADYASRGFKNFDADWFWEEYEGLCRRFKRFKHIGPGTWMDYR